MKKTILFTFIINIILIFSTCLAAKNKSPITCESSRMSKTILIKQNSITFYNHTDYNDGRAIASIERIRTKRTGKGFSKYTEFEGKRYIIHIQNEKQLNEIDDYIVIKNKKGHKITYPLSCSS